MSCIEALYDHRPFEQYSDKGNAAACAKRIAIGLIVTAALAAAVYFADMGMYSLWNPFGFSATTQMALSITSACMVGLMGLVFTAAIAYKATQND